MAAVSSPFKSPPHLSSPDRFDFFSLSSFFCVMLSPHRIAAALHRHCHLSRQRGSLHTTPWLHSPRQAPSKPHKWGSYERLSPVSLFPTPVRDRPRLAVPSTISSPSYAAEGLSSEWEPVIPRHTETDLVSLRASAQLAKKILTMGGQLCKVNRENLTLITHSFCCCPIGRGHHQ